MLKNYLFLNDINSNMNFKQHFYESNGIPFASFVIAPVGEGLFAATTRPDDPSSVALPGGKIDEGETPYDAALREAYEEGWKVFGLENKPFHVQNRNGKLIYWFRAKGAIQLEKFKEMHRLKTVQVPKDVFQTFGNPKAFSEYIPL